MHLQKIDRAEDEDATGRVGKVVSEAYVSAYVITGIASTCVEECRINMRRWPKYWIRSAIRFLNAPDYQIARDAFDPRRVDKGHSSRTKLETQIRVSVAKVPVG
jgi:hypothetical protein